MQNAELSYLQRSLANNTAILALVEFGCGDAPKAIVTTERALGFAGAVGETSPTLREAAAQMEQAKNTRRADRQAKTE
jgi:hypothetical protein